MVNTAKRRRSNRIEPRDANVKSPSQHTLSASRSSLYCYYQPSCSSQDQTLSSVVATIEPQNSGVSTRTTLAEAQSHDNMPEIPSTTDQSFPSTSLSITSVDENKDTIKAWILANYERVPNVKAVVPRSDIYEHYRYACPLKKMRFVNAAMFGKMIRAAFPGIKTRRLGNRGQSRYQYSNIQRIESPRTDKYYFTEFPIQSDDHQQDQHYSEELGSTDNDTRTDVDNSVTPSSPGSSATRHQPSSSESNLLHSIYDTQGFPSNRLPPPIRFTPSSASSTSSTSHLHLVPRLGDLLSDLSESNKPYQQNYTPPSPPRHISSSTSSPTLNSFTSHLNDEFAIHYNHHCRDLYNVICAGQFDQVQGVYECFYYKMSPPYHALLKSPNMIDAIWRWDCLLYDSLIVNLLPEVDTAITKQMMSGLLQFTRALPKFLSFLLRDYSAALRQKKHDVASIFVAKMRRHLTLNRFAIIASNVLRQADLVENMKEDWERLDVGVIQDHVFWVCDCKSDDICQIVEQDIPRLLNHASTMNSWINWVENLINKYLPDGPKTPKIEQAMDYLQSGKQFMLKWKVYTGLIMQEFYAMNAFSIDSLKSLQQFLDDLVLYYIEERIAKMNADINPSERTSSRATTPFFTSNGLLISNHEK